MNKKQNNKWIPFSIIILVVLIVMFHSTVYSLTGAQGTTKLTVTSVLDGDTVRLSNGEKVRLIGINTPESGRACFSEATNKLTEFVLGKEITLEQDAEDRDQYGRSLRYIYLDGVFINLEMVRAGLAYSYRYGSNTKYSAQFDQAENEARQNKGCLWKVSQKEYIQDQCIHIMDFHFDAWGNDNCNLNDEYVIFGNKCSYPIDMVGWTVKDESASHLYHFLSFTFLAGGTFTLSSGLGRDTNSVLYWGRTSGTYATIWNNDGDTLYLRDLEGDLVLEETYPGH